MLDYRNIKVGAEVRLNKPRYGLQEGAIGKVMAVETDDPDKMNQYQRSGGRMPAFIHWTGHQSWTVAEDFDLVAPVANPVPPKPLTKSQRAIARKELELAHLKAQAEKRAAQAAERKAANERKKLLAKLSPAGRRMVEVMRIRADR